MPRSPIEMKPERGALTLPRKVQEAARQRCRSTARSTCRAMAPPTPIQRYDALTKITGKRAIYRLSVYRCDQWVIWIKQMNRVIQQK